MKCALSAIQRSAFCLVVAACANVVEPVGPIHVRAPDVVIAPTDPSPPDARVSVPLQITNAGTRSVMLNDRCGWRLQMLNAGQWVHAVAPLCVGVAMYQPIEIAPGVTVTMNLAEHPSRFDSVRSGSPITGTYRAIVFLHPKDDGRPLPESDRTSNSFAVTQ